MDERFLERLRKAMRPQKAPPVLPRAGPRHLFVEEGAIGQIEVLPASLAVWCAQKSADIANATPLHAAADAIALTDIGSRRPPFRIAALAIPFARAVEAIGRLLAPFDEIVTTNPSAGRPVGGLRAFGPSPGAAIVLGEDLARRNLASIDIVLRCGRSDVTAVFTALASLPSPEALLVADWRRAACVRLDHAQEVEGYLRKFAAN